MKKLLVLLIIIFAIIGYSSTYDQLAKYDITKTQDLEPDSVGKRAIGSSTIPYKGAYIAHVYGEADDADSLGGSYWNEYLTNVNDTFGTLTGSSFFVSDTLHTFAMLPYGFGIYNPAFDSAFAGFDTIGLTVMNYANQIGRAHV